MTLGMDFPADGIDAAVPATGACGVAEIPRNLDNVEMRDVVKQAIGRLLPGREEMYQSAAPIALGTLTGLILGILSGFVLGRLMEENVRRALLVSRRHGGLHRRPDFGLPAGGRRDHAR